MAAMARRANNPQEIQAIQKSLVAGVQNGSIQPYVGIPLIQDLTKKLAEATAKMAQSVAGAGMPQPPADGPPIAQQVMQQAAQESQGVEALPSNLPQSYAGGGIIAFEDGGKVERYQNAGFTGGQEFGISDPVAEAVDDLKYEEKARLEAIRKAEARAKFLREAGAPQAAEAEAKLAALKGPNPYDPATATLRRNFTNDPIPATPGAAAAPSAAPSAAIPGAGNFKMPTLAGMTMPGAPASTNYQTLLGDTEAKTKRAGDTANKETLEKLESFDEPGNAAREEKYSKREAAQAKNSAMDRALNIMNFGFGVAGSREGTLAGALNKEGREGIRDLLKGEAANRAALDKLDDLRDNFEQQKTAAKKGNYQAAQAAKERAVDNVYKYQDLNMKAAHYGNTEALQRYHTEMQGNYQQAALNNQGVLGLSDLDLKKRQLNQSAASASAQLQLGRERLNIIKGQIAAGDKRAQAALANVEQKAYAAFQTSSDYRVAQEKAKKMPPIEAQRYMQQEWTRYSANAMPSLLAAEGGGVSVPSFADLMKAEE
jgi:hypothetical protein